MDEAAITSLCNSLLNEKGFECYPFQLGWYNSLITSERYRLNFDDTLAITTISIPGMFETTFLPWLRMRKENLSDVLDPIDDCMREVFSEFRKNLPPSLNVEIIHDFEMNRGRYPRVLMNTAGHVSGAAYYYQKSDLGDEYRDKKLFSVSVHPKYGGWFAFRAVLIFPQISASNLQRPQLEPRDCTIDEIHNLLKSFTFEWYTNEWRDVFVSTQEKYSDMQMQYFSLTPARRKELLKVWLEEGRL